MIRLTDLVTNAGTQMRTTLSQERITEYAEAMSEGAEFPPIVVFDDGQRLILAGGFHRYEAMTRLKRTHTQADVRKGTLRDAIKYALGDNSTHGMPRTQADKHKVVDYALNDVELSQLSNPEIAALCGVTRQFVMLKRKKAVGNITQKPAKPAAAPVEQPVEEFDERDDALDELSTQVEDLKAKLAVQVLPEHQQKEAAEYIDELREENHLLKQQLEAVKRSRDQYMAENAQLKKQVAMQLKKMKEAGI